MLRYAREYGYLRDGEPSKMRSRSTEAPAKAEFPKRADG
jgi:hypothetical protein